MTLLIAQHARDISNQQLANRMNELIGKIGELVLQAAKDYKSSNSILLQGKDKELTQLLAEKLLSTGYKVVITQEKTMHNNSADLITFNW